MWSVCGYLFWFFRPVALPSLSSFSFFKMMKFGWMLRLRVTQLIISCVEFWHIIVRKVHGFGHNASVWHSRFGHLYEKIRKLLSHKIPFHLSHDFSTSNCNICILAKFRKLSFIASNNVSASPFDLIHCDIWGPYKNPTYDGKIFFPFLWSTTVFPFAPTYFSILRWENQTYVVLSYQVILFLLKRWSF